MTTTTQLRVAGLALTLSVGLNVHAAEDARVADHDALRGLKSKVTDAINRQDYAALSTCLAKEFSFTAVNQKLATRPEDVKAIFDDFFHGPTAVLKSLKVAPEADALTRFVDDHTGIATGTTRDTYVLKTGQTVVLDARWTATVVKENGEWKVAAAHVGVDPLDNPIRAITGSFWKKVCIGAALAGLVVGFLLARFIGRSRR